MVYIHHAPLLQEALKHIYVPSETTFFPLLAALVEPNFFGALVEVSYLGDFDEVSYPDDVALEASYLDGAALESPLSHSDAEEVEIYFDDIRTLVDHHVSRPARYPAVHETVISRDSFCALVFADALGKSTAPYNVAWQIHLSIGDSALSPSPPFLISPFSRVDEVIFHAAFEVIDFPSLGTYSAASSAPSHLDIDSSFP